MALPLVRESIAPEIGGGAGGGGGRAAFPPVQLNHCSAN